MLIVNRSNLKDQCDTSINISRNMTNSVGSWDQLKAGASCTCKALAPRLFVSFSFRLRLRRDNAFKVFCRSPSGTSPRFSRGSKIMLILLGICCNQCTEAGMSEAAPRYFHRVWMSYFLCTLPVSNCFM